MKAPTVLISGLGIAGPTLAFWLHRYGFEPTIVESAPLPREGGYIIDFWGIGFDVAERMAIIPEMRRQGYDLDEIKFVDGNGRGVAAISAKSFQLIMGDRYLSILRSNLARILYETVRNDVECMFGDTLVSLLETRDGIEATFATGSSRRFDLVIGADGLHSNVRRLLFGAEKIFEKYYGYYTAAYTVRSYDTSDAGAYVSHTVPGKQVARFLLSDDRAAAFFIFRQPEKLPGLDHDVESQKSLLRSVFSDVSWECPQLLAQLDAAPDFYFDSVSQIVMPSWSKGRAALVGDACSCPSLLSGQGSAIAMAGAYVLAGELSASAGDYRIAFQKYEAQFRGFAEQKQKSAKRFAGSFVPKTRLGIWTRNKTSSLLSFSPIASWFGKRFLADPLRLKDYA